MDAATIARWRMRSQRLWSSDLATPGEVVSWLGASQGQDYLPAKWSIAQRCARSVTDVQLDEEFAAGRLLRTHMLRPTWHFTTPADIRWLLTATAPRVHAANTHYYRKLGLDDTAFATAERALRRALGGGVQLTRSALIPHLEEAGLDVDGLALGYVLMHAELEGVICSGALQGRQQTYALLDDRAPRAGRGSGQTDSPGDAERPQALAELARRYFTSRGPATVRDLARWASLTIAEASSALESVAAELASLEADGRSYWFAGDPDRPVGRHRVEPPRVDLVQSLDEIVMSYSESKDVLHADLPTSSETGPDPSFFHAVLVDGRVAGRWRYRRGPEFAIETFFYSRPKGAELEAMDEAVGRFAAFLDRPVTWS